jgi:hypothetical protein
MYTFSSVNYNVGVTIASIHGRAREVETALKGRKAWILETRM